MNTVLLIARVLLAGVFIVAGLGKLADLKGSRQAMRDFGVPTALAAAFGTLLPLAELVVVVGLILAATAWWGALGALGLLLLFVVGIGYNLARGRRPDCHCFGQLHSAPAGWPTLIRNLLLAAVAGFILWQGSSNAGPGVLDWFGALAIAQRIEVIVGVLVVAVVALEGWLLFHSMAQQGRLLSRMEALEAGLAAQGIAPVPVVGDASSPVVGLPVGSAAPTFSLASLDGGTVTLDALRAAGKPVVLVFSDPGCGPCTALMPELGRWQREYASKLTLALISRGKPEDNRVKATEQRVTTILLQKDREVAEAYQYNGTPSAVLVRRDGTIGSALATGAEAIRGLVAGAAGLPVLRTLPMAAPAPLNGNGNGKSALTPAMPSRPGALKRGEQAPDFSLPDLSGKLVSLTNFRGSQTLVLFWRPSCGYCKRMLDDLKAWEANPPQGAPKLLVVSTDSVEDNKAQGLRSPVVLDKDGLAIGGQFGANGTPMAVLIDAEGKIASDLVVGRVGVLTLAGVENVAEAAAPSQPAALKVGEQAPNFTLPDLDGKQMSLADFRGHKTLVLFWRPSCGFCERMLPDLKAWEDKPPKGAPRLLVVSTESVEANKAMGLRSPVVLDKDGLAIGNKFGVTGTPIGVLVDAEGKIASELAVGAAAVLTLAGVENAAAAGQSAVPKVGEQAPDFTLPDLDGKQVSLTDFRGHKTLVLFWRPSCGFCERMLPDLKAWEAKPPKGTPKLLVVSTESVEANKAMGLRSPVVLDKDGLAIGGKFGANGTPIGVLVDAEGKVASDLAIGASQVLALVGAKAPAFV